MIGIKTRVKVKRDRFLQSDELPRLFQAVAEEANVTMRDYVLLALLTGARRANLLAMKWAEINLTEAVWRIPVTKNGTPNGATLHDLRGQNWRIASNHRQEPEPSKPADHHDLCIPCLTPVRQSVNTATSAMMEAAGLKPVAEILDLKKRTIK